VPYVDGMPRLVLWDVDHTLIENAGVSKDIYATALARLTNQPARRTAQTEGRTDPDIMAEMLHSHGMPSYPWAEVQHALETAGAEHRRALGERGSVLPGVSELIAALANRDAVQTIVTGNIRANAEVKLGALGLLRWLDLDVGGYGSDDRERSRLVALAKTRAAAKYGTEFGEDRNTVVIGDTPRDVEAARGGGVRVLAVASGIHTVAELHAAGADCVMASLTDMDVALEFVLG
jgi:phosphoglycolate phosphatase